MGQRDITKERFIDGKPILRRFHQARWDEPVIFELSCPGQRGILLPGVEEEIEREAGDVLSTLPEYIRRSQDSIGSHCSRLPVRLRSTPMSLSYGHTTNHGGILRDVTRSSPRSSLIPPMRRAPKLPATKS